jgi:membrane-bound lytic murein transglycosylase B
MADRRAFLAALAVVPAAPWLAPRVSAAPLSPEADLFAAEVAERNGLPANAVRELLGQARLQTAILRAMMQPATARTWREYRPAYLNPKRIADGIAFWNTHRDTVAAASTEFGVPGEVIVSIIGVETFYGRVTGTHRVLDALYTLAFAYPPRAELFRSELENFIVLAGELKVNPLRLRGSFAGAMGIPQFLPSSYRKFAVDFDRDGRVDLWRPADAIGSVGSYFRAFGWRTGAPVIASADVTGPDYRSLIERGIKPELAVGRLRELGVTPRAELDGEALAAVIETEGADGLEHWVALENFYVITRYNRSVNYALAVYELAQELRRARGAAAD